MAKRAPTPDFDASTRIVILRGPERFLRDLHTQRLAAALEAQHGGIERFTLDGATTEPAQVLDELRSYGLMQEHKLVVVDQAERMLVARDDAPRGRKTARELFERYAAEPVDSATLLLRAETWRPGKLDKLVAKVGAVIKCEAPGEGEAMRFAVNRAKAAHGIQLDQAAASALIRRTGPDLGRIDTELGKLAAFVGPEGTVGEPEIRTLVGTTREEQAWALQSALLSGSPRATVHKLRELVEISQQPETLLAWAMTDLLRKLHAAARRLESGAPEGAVAKELRLWGDDRRTVPAVARRVGGHRLAGLLDRALEADRGTKTGLGRAGRTLEVMAVEIADTIRCG